MLKCTLDVQYTFYEKQYNGWCCRQKLPLDSTLELSLATHVGLSLGYCQNIVITIFIVFIIIIKVLIIIIIIMIYEL